MGIAVGLDGCRTGWIAAVVRDGRLIAIEYRESARAALEAYPRRVRGVSAGRGVRFRHPDRPEQRWEARRRRTGARSSSASAPTACSGRRYARCSTLMPRAYATHREAYAEARRVSERASGGRQSISSQSFMLVPKIREVDALAAADARIHEAHPEVSFAVLAGGQALPSKKTWDGLMQRRALLSAAGLAIPDLGGRREPSRGGGRHRGRRRLRLDGGPHREWRGVHTARSAAAARRARGRDLVLGRPRQADLPRLTSLVRALHLE